MKLFVKLDWYLKYTDLSWQNLSFYWFFEYYVIDIVWKSWFEIWNQGIKIILSGEFQLIILSIDWDNEISPKKNKSFFYDLAKQKRQKTKQ